MSNRTVIICDRCKNIVVDPVTIRVPTGQFEDVDGGWKLSGATLDLCATCAVWAIGRTFSLTAMSHETGKQLAAEIRKGVQSS